MTEREIRAKVEELVREYKTSNPFELCDHLNIKVEHHNLGKLKGYYYSNRKTKFVRINNALERKSERHVCGHELGHAIMHPELNTMFLCNNTHLVINKYEKEANLFASILEEYNKEIEIC